MENGDINFSAFLKSMDLERYRIQFFRVPNKPYVYIKTLGLINIGLKEVFTISRSPVLEEAELLLKCLVRRILETGQTEGIRKDLIVHPTTKKPLRYLVKKSLEEADTLIVVGPDENNKLPGEIGYIEYK